MKTIKLSDPQRELLVEALTDFQEKIIKFKNNMPYDVYEKNKFKIGALLNRAYSIEKKLK